MTTPIARLAKGAAPAGRKDGGYFFKRLERVTVSNCSPAYLNGHTGIVVALQTHAVVVKMDRPAALAGKKYLDDNNGCVRFDSNVLTEA